MNSKISKTLVLGSIVSLSLLSCKKEEEPTPSSSSNPASTTSARIYSTSNANGNVGVFNFANMASPSVKLLGTTSTAADGAYYSKSEDKIYFNSRSQFKIEAYGGVASSTDGGILSIDISSSADAISPRELAVKGNFFVVVDNADVDADPNTLDGRLLVYEKSGSSFTLRNTIITDFKLWGATFKGDDLYVVVDADNELAVYTNFLSNTSDATLSASKRVVIEGLVRTHGITYDASSDVMVLTDIGSAANTTDDGGFTIISNFSSKFNATANGGTIALTDQIRVDGAATTMGNPVDVAYDAATKSVFIAEAGNGKILVFNNVTANGSSAPDYSYDFAGASSVYLTKE